MNNKGLLLIITVAALHLVETSITDDCFNKQVCI